MQDPSVMMADIQSFARPSKHDRKAHEMEQLRIPPELDDFQLPNNHQHQTPDGLTHHWIADASPTGYATNGYVINDLHVQTPVSANSFRMSDAGLLSGDLQQMEMPNGLPLMGNMTYDTYPPHTRAQPLRMMSTPNPLIMDHHLQEAHGLSMDQSSFYTT